MTRRVGRFTFVCVALVAISLGWNAIVHLVLLRPVDETVRHLFRPDLGDRIGLSLLMTAGVACLFAAGYARFARDGSVREGAFYGACFALLAGLLVDLNQYLLYPIPAWVAATWFASGLVEFTLYGIVVSRIVPPGRGLSPASDPLPL